MSVASKVSIVTVEQPEGFADLSMMLVIVKKMITIEEVLGYLFENL